jgi:hypothetical protein
MHIVVISGKSMTTFTLNNSPAAKALCAQLPLEIAVEAYGGNEVIFYPPKKLDISETPAANAKAGTLAYYAPWGDVVMFYKDFGRASGLYELGHVVSGGENVPRMSGMIRVDRSAAP